MIEIGRQDAAGGSAIRLNALYCCTATMVTLTATIVHAIIEAESTYSPRAISRAGAIGLMLLMPTPAMELGVNPYVPEQNIEGGIRYLAGLLRTFGRLR